MMIIVFRPIIPIQSLIKEQMMMKTNPTDFLKVTYLVIMDLLINQADADNQTNESENMIICMYVCLNLYTAFSLN